MSEVIADTHAVVWFLLDDPRLSVTARIVMESALAQFDPIHVATISLVEVAYLVERGRIHLDMFNKIYEVLTDIASGFEPVPLTLEIADSLRSIPRDIVPDMPDRIIAATALKMNLPLITKDGRIQSAPIVTIW